MQEWLCKTVDGDDLERHDKWLCMMWPRLHLLRELLSDDGVIFVSIDDNEQHHLRMMMDEVFGDNGFISVVAVVSNLAGSSDQFGFAGAHEYCLVYSKNRDSVNLGRFSLNEDKLAEWLQDEIGFYKPEQLKRGSLTYSDSLHYPIWVDEEDNIVVTEDDSTPDSNGQFTSVYPIMQNGKKGIWRWSKKRILENKYDVYARRRDNGEITIYSKQRPQLGELPTEKPKTVFYKTEYSSRSGGRALSTIISDNSFSYPKSVDLITDFLRIATGPNDIVLDSFAGSGTTAHAVLALNKEDGGNRKFILVECEKYADSITAERVRRVIRGVPSARDKSLKEGLGGSFTYCTLGEPIDLESMLTGEGLPEFSALAAYLLHTADGLSAGESELEPLGKDGLFYESETTRYHLLYKPSVEWLRSNDAALNKERAERISKAAGKDKRAVVFAAAKYIGQRDLTRMGITFCQLPYELHRAG